MKRHTIEELLQDVQHRLLERFGESVTCLILYGSWAKGLARKNSDIDLLVIFDNVSSETRQLLWEIERDIERERKVTLVPATMDEFRREKSPLHTAVKKEGKIILGTVDLSCNPEPPHAKYAEYFEKSREFERRKVEMAERILEEHPSYGSADLCFVASKHAVQMALAMRGVGYSSKIAVLLPLAEKHLGKDVAGSFGKLIDLYAKAEYGIEFLTEDEAKLAVEYAKGILDLCYRASNPPL